MSKVALKAVFEARKFQQAIAREQNYLLGKNPYELDSSKDISGEKLATIVKENLTQDQKKLATIQETITNYPVKEKLLCDLTTNKMTGIFKGVQDLLEANETSIASIASGKLPNGYDNAIAGLPELGGGKYWGSSQSTFVSAAILLINFSITEGNINTINVPTSAITYSIPIPQDITILENYRWNYNKDGVNSFGIVHSGFSFGGMRNQPYKEFAPNDCSSFLEKITNCPYPLSTADQLCVYRTNAKFGFIPEGWLATRSAPASVLYEVVKPEDIQIGDIYVHRRFKEGENHTQSLGTGGHTATVINKDQKEVTTIGANRDMPNIEGIGLQTFPIISTDPNKEIYFLRVTSHSKEIQYPHTLQDLGFEYNGSNLNDVVAHFDKMIIGDHSVVGEEISF